MFIQFLSKLIFDIDKRDKLAFVCSCYVLLCYYAMPHKQVIVIREFKDLDNHDRAIMRII